MHAPLLIASPLRLCLAFLLWGGVPLLAFPQTLEEDDLEAIALPANVLKQESAADLRRAADLIIDKTNDFRLNQQLQRVETSPKLMETARDFADFMAQSDQYGHTADGNRPSQRVKQHGYEYCVVAENIAYQFSSLGFATEELAEKFFAGWKHSPGHRENMLNPAVTETGVAIAQSDTTGYFYAVQLFGRPKSKQITFQVTNQADTTVQYQIGDRSFPLPPHFTRTHKRCRPTKLVVVSQQESERPAKTFTAADGARFVIAKDGKSVTVEEKSD
jgi:uncharacterized protein YkwD